MTRGDITPFRSGAPPPPSLAIQASSDEGPDVLLLSATSGRRFLYSAPICMFDSSLFLSFLLVFSTIYDAASSQFARDHDG